MPLILLLLGCRPPLDPQEATWLEGFRFSWDYFNHRLSTLDVAPAGDELRVAIIGGTSTTGEQPGDLGAECSTGCEEFPFVDRALLTADWIRVRSDRVALVSGSVALDVGRAGGSGTVSVTLPKHATGDAVAVIEGLRLVTDHPLDGGDACYRPRYGWHPRRIAAVLGEPVVDGEQVSVGVDLAFEAGVTEDPDRTCIDEVVDRAVVGFEVTVRFVVGVDDAVALPVANEAVYPFSGDGLNPEEQPEVEPAALDHGLTDPALGWSAIDFRFMEAEPGRGAYLRTLAFEADPAGTALGWANNYSPGTQLEGFDYSFEGTVRAFTMDATIERGTVDETLQTELDTNGDPVVHTIPL